MEKVKNYFDQELSRYHRSISIFFVCAPLRGNAAFSNNSAVTGAWVPRK